jgi:hypothetical protein
VAAPAEPGIDLLVAALCVRLAEDDGPLGTDPVLRRRADDLVAAVRAGTGDDRLAELFTTLDAALREAGFARGLAPAQLRALPDRYGPLPGLDVHAVHTVLRCPAARRCLRVERATHATRLDPPICRVHGEPLQRERLGR